MKSTLVAGSLVVGVFLFGCDNGTSPSTGGTTEPVAENLYTVASYAEFETALEDPDGPTEEHIIIEVINDIGPEGFERNGRLRSDTGQTDITIRGEEAANVVLDAGGHSGILRLDTEASITVDNLTFRNGYLDDDYGAALSAAKGRLRIRDSRFEDNTTVESYSSGGAIRGGAYVEISDSTFTGNKAVDADDDEIGTGGAVATSSSEDEVNLLVVGSEFRDNVAGREGGAVSSAGEIDVRDSLFDGNAVNFYDSQGPQGLALFSNRATISVGSSTFRDHVYGGDSESSDRTIFNHGGELVERDDENAFEPQDQQPPWTEPYEQ